MNRLIYLYIYIYFIAASNYSTFLYSFNAPPKVKTNLKNFTMIKSLYLFNKFIFKNYIKFIS